MNKINQNSFNKSVPNHRKKLSLKNEYQMVNAILGRGGALFIVSIIAKAPDPSGRAV